MNANKKFSRWMGMAVGTMVLTRALAGFAATTNVTVAPGGSLTFSPAVVHIHTGDRVIWTWTAGGHTSTSGTSCTANGLWNSSGLAFTNTFNSTGTFAYFCVPHCSLGMTGAVVVTAAALPPTVSITNPVNGATFSALASFTLAATASSSSGTITNVQFFQGATSLGNVTSSPYSVPVSSLTAADYTFSAVASDNAGLTATNSITIHVVTPVSIVLSAPQFLPPADFRFNYTANSGLTYIVQRSTNLDAGNWMTLGTNQAGGNPVLFDDTNAAGSPAFYRVGRLPNP